METKCRRTGYIAAQGRDEAVVECLNHTTVPPARPVHQSTSSSRLTCAASSSLTSTPTRHSASIPSQLTHG